MPFSWMTGRCCAPPSQWMGLVRTALGNLPVMAGLAAIMLILAYFMAKWQTRRLVKPIYDLDLEHPLDNETYDELTPFLEAMDRQNKEKEAGIQYAKRILCQCFP